MSEYQPVLEFARVRWLLFKTCEVIAVVLSSVFLLCLWLAAASSAEAAPSHGALQEDHGWPGDAAPEADALPHALPNHTASYSSGSGAFELRVPVRDASRSRSTSLSEPVVLVMLGAALLTASFAARRLQGRGFRVRLEATVLGPEWIAAREAEEAAMARWSEFWHLSKRRAKPVDTAPVLMPPQSRDVAALGSVPPVVSPF